MSKIEKTVRDWISRGKAEARRKCEELGEPHVTAFNRVTNAVYYYDGLGEAVSFAESLGWVDRFGDAQNGEWSATIADSCEAEVLEYIKSKGYRVWWVIYNEEV
tara:strand:+ start:941 stop:1252 length:312 start_codon:yes stop_codon:yes gene_type:complete